MSVFLWFVDTSVWCMSFCPTFGTIGDFGTVSLKVTRQIAVKAKALIRLSRLLPTAFHPSTIHRFWYALFIFSCNGRLRRLVSMRFEGVCCLCGLGEVYCVFVGNCG